MSCLFCIPKMKCDAITDMLLNQFAGFCTPFTSIIVGAIEQKLSYGYKFISLPEGSFN